VAVDELDDAVSGTLGRCQQREEAMGDAEGRKRPCGHGGEREEDRAIGIRGFEPGRGRRVVVTAVAGPMRMDRPAPVMIGWVIVRVCVRAALTHEIGLVRLLSTW
jgi:hypothetical protein